MRRKWFRFVSVKCRNKQSIMSNGLTLVEGKSSLEEYNTVQEDCHNGNKNETMQRKYLRCVILTD
jgi:hypothetical protein